MVPEGETLTSMKESPVEVARRAGLWADDCPSGRTAGVDGCRD